VNNFKSASTVVLSKVSKDAKLTNSNENQGNRN